MEIAVSFNSSIDLLLRYQKSRIPWSIFASLALFLCIASATSRWPTEVGKWCFHWTLALCMVVQFRLWDDLADVENDRGNHPSRVLCQTQSHQVFWGLVGTLCIVNTVLIATFKSYIALAAFFVLNVAYVLWYSMPRKMSSDHVVVHAMVLLKYPVFVFLLSGPRGEWHLSLSLCYGMLVTFLCFCAYELQHDERLRANRHAVTLLAFAFSSLCFVAILMLIELRRNASVLTIGQAGLLVVGSIILAFLFRQFQGQAASGWWQFGVFFVGFAWLLNFALGNSSSFDPPHRDTSTKLHVPTNPSKGTRV
jgi:hypothetical protein